MTPHMRLGPDGTVVHYCTRLAQTGFDPWRVVVATDAHYFTQRLSDVDVAGWTRLVPLSRTEVIGK